MRLIDQNLKQKIETCHKQISLFLDAKIEERQEKLRSTLFRPRIAIKDQIKNIEKALIARDGRLPTSQELAAHKPVRLNIDPPEVVSKADDLMLSLRSARERQAEIENEERPTILNAERFYLSWANEKNFFPALFSHAVYHYCETLKNHKLGSADLTKELNVEFVSGLLDEFESQYNKANKKPGKAEEKQAPAPAAKPR